MPIARFVARPGHAVGVEVGGALAGLADHGDEAAQFGPLAVQVIAVAGEDDRAGLATPAQRHDEPAAVAELLAPGWWQVPGADGDDDAVVGSVVGVAMCAVGGGHPDVLVASDHRPVAAELELAG